jgi:hypothetical protein
MAAGRRWCPPSPIRCERILNKTSAHRPVVIPLRPHILDSETLLHTSTAQDMRHRPAPRQTGSETPAMVQGTEEAVPMNRIGKHYLLIGCVQAATLLEYYSTRYLSNMP